MALSLKALVKRFAREERGASFVEYAMLTGLVAAVVIAGIAILEGGISGIFTNIATTLNAVDPGTPPVR